MNFSLYDRPQNGDLMQKFDSKIFILDFIRMPAHKIFLR
ncbi:hypothetical protein LEP1GSC168_0396 [Leptospira santarosai str. HAI134]|nr:hypothetical protein LEP1GSC168_0396 [Leptospira santarosai str. HAI134]